MLLPCAWERVPIDFINPNPPIIHGLIQYYISRLIATLKDVHDNFDMGIGMPNTGEKFNALYAEVDFFLKLSCTGNLSCISRFYLAPRKLPQSTEQALRFALRD